MKLKSAIAILFAVPVVAFGGTCYKATARVPRGVPAVLCLEKLVETNTGDELLVINGNDGFPPVLTITELSRHNEDRVNFTAKNVMQDTWEAGCGEGLLTTLTIKGEIVLGEINPAQLNVSVEAQRTHDTCHSPTRIEVINYIAE